MVEQLLAHGAWRGLRDAAGEWPVDVGSRRGHAHLLPLLEPVRQHDVPPDALARIAVIRGRVAGLVCEHALRLPELEPLLELPRLTLWFAVPGMYGGFNFGLERLGGDWVLVMSSWCRVASESGQRHLVSPHGSLLLDEGFV